MDNQKGTVNFMRIHVLRLYKTYGFRHQRFKTHRAVIIIIIIVTFMQVIYNCIIETTRVSRVYSVAAVLYLEYVLHVTLFRM
jgi:hypothetical protein